MIPLRSLRFQSLAGTILIVAVSQVLTVAAMTFLIVRPQIDRAAAMLAQNVAVLTETYDTLPVEARPVLIRRLEASSYLALWQGDKPPDRTGPRPRYMERAFMRSLAERLNGQAHLDWRTDARGKLWVQIFLGGTPYWIGLKSTPFYAPTGMIIWLGVIAVCLASAAAVWLSRQLLRPLEALQNATDRVYVSEKPQMLEEQGLVEIAELSRSFNRMTGRLTEIEDNRALVLAGISHDLRTPLAKLRLALDMASIADTDLRLTAERQVESIERILSQFLVYARGFEAEVVEPFSLNALISLAAADYAQAGVEISLPDTEQILTGRCEALRRLLCNLIENALRYGQAPVTVFAIIAEGGLRFGVRDQGEGFRPEQAELLTKPFVRGDEARQPVAGQVSVAGVGLGLAMAQQITRLHGWELTFKQTARGFEVAIETGAPNKER
ncbi:HAMP domain-containing protein [Asticcacaulis sp. DW145]|uniref:ATP-binding protein n=1 Tax=Asticcacaulis sp. DW145 TaxID=3095608 RepID=UPI00308965D0|nr:HAMP domain-containing protein [Asticcacaulis sp. DW145]